MLKEKKYFLFDIDGTLSVGTTLYDGTKEFLDWIAEKIMWKNLRRGALPQKRHSL